MFFLYLVERDAVTAAYTHAPRQMCHDTWQKGAHALRSPLPKTGTGTVPEYYSHYVSPPVFPKFWEAMAHGFQQTCTKDQTEDPYIKLLHLLHLHSVCEGVGTFVDLLNALVFGL